ncbi:MAG: outer membrane beta-barrel protein [Pseudobdellovibrio sp.]
MKRFIRSIPMYILAAVCIISVASVSHAAKKRGGRGAFAGGSLSAGLGIAISTADQTGMNSLINAAKAATASSAGSMGSATEYIGYFTFRFSNNFVALQLRPSFFSQSASGSGTDGSHSYNLDGFTIFPMVRIIPLSNDLIDFYVQGGLGYAKLDGEIKNGAARSSFSGSGFGMQMGLGAEFCFVPDHCFNVEGNYRYLPISRNIVSSATGLPTGTSQNQTDRELEDASGNDVATTLSGVSGLLSYTYNF